MSHAPVLDRADGARIDAALAAVDAALATAWRQELLTRSDAASLLLDTRSAVAAAPHPAAVEAVDATLASLDGELVDHMRVVDTLLDLRLVLAG
ncbi:MAG TPA: hypothetical protein VF152_07950 [Acidimicrobiia bacterium]